MEHLCYAKGSARPVRHVISFHPTEKLRRRQNFDHPYFIKDIVFSGEPETD